jgi:hypothetical protein
VKYTIFKTSKRTVSGELRIDRKLEEIGRGYWLGVFPQGMSEKKKMAFKDSDCKFKHGCNERKKFHLLRAGDC